MRVSFTIPGPARGKGRPKFASRGKFVRVYTDDKTASYESLVKLAAQEAAARIGWRPLPTSAFTVRIVARSPIPASWPAWKREAALAGAIAPTGKPDWDNIGKIVCDAANGILWPDDAAVVDGGVVKAWGDASAEVIVTARAMPSTSAEWRQMSRLPLDLALA